MSETEKKMSKAETEFVHAIDTVYITATEADKTVASQIGKSGGGSRKENLSSAVAAVLFHDYNKKNRDISYGKVYAFRDAIKRGEWKLNHQGLAFYDDGTLADGQHRCANTIRTRCIRKHSRIVAGSSFRTGSSRLDPFSPQGRTP